MMINKRFRELIGSKYLYIAIASIVSAYSLYVYWAIKYAVWHPTILFLVLPLYWFYDRYEVEREKRVYIATFAVTAVSLALLLLSTGTYDATAHLGVGYLKLVICIVGLAVTLFYFINYAIKTVLKLKLLDLERNSNRKFFIVSWFIILLAWLPYLLAYFPSIMSPDSIDQWLQAVGKSGLSNHHPVAHTLLVRLTTWPLHGNPLGYTIFQMLFLSIALAMIVYWLYRKGLKRGWLYLVVAYFALHPLNAMYSLTMWKDVIFSVFVALLTLVFTELVLSYGKSGDKPYWLIGLFLSALGVLFFRNNGLYIVFPSAILLVLVVKNNRYRIMGVLALAVAIYLIVLGPIFGAYGIKKSSLTESLGIPIQQVARTVVENGNISASDSELIADVIPLDDIRTNYTRAGVDPIKFNRHFKIVVIDENKPEYLGLWSRLMVDNPRIYITAYLDATRGFWDPLSRNWSVYYDTYHNDYGLTQVRAFPTYSFYLEKIISGLNWRLPFYLLWSGAVLNYLMLFSGVVMIIRKDYVRLVIGGPMLFGWATLLIATPIATSTRYIYSSFILFPIVLFAAVYGYNILDKNKKAK